jgi:catechol 2,3-dioxygenase-like lactoylglutathione lyase family enzyme
MKYICPLLVVEDIDLSRRFYEQILDQKVKYDFGENVTFDGDFAIHQKNHYNNLLNLTTSQHSPTPYHSHELYFEDDQIESLETFFTTHKVKFVHPIQEQPWGQRVIRIYDPDGHIIEIGESMDAVVCRFFSQGMSPEDIAKRIGMPMEFVNSVLE